MTLEFFSQSALSNEEVSFSVQLARNEGHCDTDTVFIPKCWIRYLQVCCKSMHQSNGGRFIRKESLLLPSSALYTWMQLGSFFFLH